MTRFNDAWWLNFDKPSDGYRDFTGFVHRLPIRMESADLVVYGTVDAKTLVADAFEDEFYTPIIVGEENHAVISISFRNISDSDCGGKYYEIVSAVFVSPKDEKPMNVPFTTPFSLLEVAGLPRTHTFALILILGDHPDNPGGAKKGIICGRDVFGLPKHPVPGNLQFNYAIKDEEKVEIEFSGSHNDKNMISMRCKLPSHEENFSSVPMDVPRSSNNSIIGSPCYGGVHKGFHGAFQSNIESAVKCSMSISLWNTDTDSFELGDDEHFASQLKRWNFKPLIKAHAPDFKMCLFKPTGWIDGSQAANAMKEYEAKLNEGTKGGEL